MDEKEIENVIGQRLATLTTENPISWPNKDHSGQRPFYKFDLIRVSKTDSTLDGTNPVSRGYAMIMAVTESNKFASEGTDMATAAQNLFPKGLKLPITGAVVQIMKPAEMLTAFQSKVGWNTPVRVDYEAF